jgi:hypothetical protein
LPKSDTGKPQNRLHCGQPFEDFMRLTRLALLSVAALAATAASISTPAGAQSRERYVYTTVRDADGRIVRDANGRPVRARTRVVVAPRDFLDAGTNVVPGERKFLDYAFPPGYGPGSTPGGVVTNFGNGRPGWDTWPSYNSSGPGFSGW